MLLFNFKDVIECHITLNFNTSNVTIQQLLREAAGWGVKFQYI